MFNAFDDINFGGISDEFKNELLSQGALSGIAQGLSQTRTKKELRERGFTFSNQKFSQLWNGLRDENEGFRHFTTIGVNELAIDEALPQKTYIKGRYRYIAEFTENLDMFGKPRDFTVAFDSNTRLTPRQAREQLISLAIQSYQADATEVDSIRLKGAIFNPNFDLE